MKVLEFTIGYTHFKVEKFNSDLDKVTENFFGRIPYKSQYLEYRGKLINGSTHKIPTYIYEYEVETYFTSNQPGWEKSKSNYHIEYYTNEVQLLKVDGPIFYGTQKHTIKRLKNKIKIE